MRTLDSGVVMYDVHYSDDDTGEDLTGDRIIRVGNALSTLVAREEIWQVEQGGGGNDPKGDPAYRVGPISPSNSFDIQGRDLRIRSPAGQ